MTVSAVSALVFVLAGGPAGADPKPSESELRADLAKLTEKVDGLIEDYAAKRESLREARQAESRARAALAEAERAYAEARKQVAGIASLQYQGGQQGGGSDLPSLLTAPRMDGAAVTAQLAAQQGAHLRTFAQSRDLRGRAAEEAARLTGRIAEEGDAVAARRRDAEKAIADIRRKLDALVPVGSGRRTDGSWAPQLPTGSDNITDRTRIMREAVGKRFTLPHEVGCYRSENDGGEHPLGRACDFMMSTGGSTPTAGHVGLGDEIAAWALKNRTRLGVKYVIWRQRINSGTGWRAMSDRGGVTANHFDHVHISMY
ncbi:hypothetical protein ACFYSC_24595 [Streptosporangium sp. NPDC004379]|uniref:hypothetical protein n=1 Tax=Streptosporangium sp. NPDC004379 TaxID=3366189 RepID=UPI0036A7D120